MVSKSHRLAGTQDVRGLCVLYAFYSFCFPFRLLPARYMADSSDYTDVTEEPLPDKGTKKSPFEGAPAEVKNEKKKSKSRSRHRRRRRKHHSHRGHRSKSRGGARRGRSERSGKERAASATRRGDSKVPEPRYPSKLSKEEKEEKKARNKGQGHKGSSKGAKGGGKATKTSFWVCRECGQKTAPYTAAMDQHQYLNERCLSHQFWNKMTEKAQEDSGSWYRAQQMARSTKFQRQSEAAESGWDMPAEEDDRTKSPMGSVTSVRRSPLRLEPARSGTARSWKDRESVAADRVPEQKAAKKKKKVEEKPSSDTEPEPEDSARKGKKRRPVVINIH